MNSFARNFSLVMIAVAFVGTTTSNVSAQYGVSSSSVSMFRAGLIPHPDSIVIEDFFNFHKHAIPIPTNGDTIGLDLRWGTDLATGQTREAYLQVGLATRHYDENAHIPPLNLSLVIDRSGSMSGERIEKVKQALLSFVHELREVDRVSIVTFSETATPLVDSQEVDDVRRIRDAIDSIVAEGSTNICDGLMLGYKQVAEHYDENRTNRVILLTDGLANRGVTDSEEISALSKEFNDQGIDLSTIGVGTDFNYRLMRQLARTGRGLIHFVADEKDIEKVFENELQSLLTQAARQVTVEIEFGKGIVIDHAYGYSPQYGEGKLTYSLDNLNAGATQVLPIRFSVSEDLQEDADIPVSATVRYYDVATHSRVEHEASGALRYRHSNELTIDPLTDTDVRRTISIADTAEGFKDTSRHVEAEEYPKAKLRIDQALAQARQRYPMAIDDEVARVLGMGDQYQKALGEHLKTLEETSKQ